jgi:hypothetical protein
LTKVTSPKTTTGPQLASVEDEMAHAQQPAPLAA